MTHGQQLGDWNKSQGVQGGRRDGETRPGLKHTHGDRQNTYGQGKPGPQLNINWGMAVAMVKWLYLVDCGMNGSQ